jgi:hypothetical protein
MRKAALALLALLLACAALAVSGQAVAHGRVHTHVGIGFHFGTPYYWGPWWWGPPAYYYYPAPVYVAPPEPRVYVERSQVEGAPQERPSNNWWYYCEASRGYYPYVKSCPSGWQRVPPAPPQQ